MWINPIHLGTLFLFHSSSSFILDKSISKHDLLRLHGINVPNQKKAYADFYPSTEPHDESRMPTPNPIVASQSQTANFMLYWPSIGTFTLVKGWTDDKTQEFKHAVNEVVQRNPILTGKARKSGSFNKAKIEIIPNAYLPHDGTHEFVNELDYGDHHMPDLNMLNETQVINFMDEFLAPMVPKAESVIESVTRSSPLFAVDLIHLPNDYACYVVKLSHCVGDGVTYYNIMDEINHIFNKKAIKVPIDWYNETISKHEVFPERFSFRDAQRAYGFPFLLGLLRNLWNIRKQRKRYVILSKEKVDKKRAQIAAVEGGSVSANDVITAAICEANLSSDMFAFTMDMRERHVKFGGNFHNEILFPKSAVLSRNHDHGSLSPHPTAFRRILKKGYYYERNDIPSCPFVLGRVGRISSLATIQKLIVDDEMEVVCHTMLSNFVQNIPLDAAFIASMNKNSFVLLHNFREMNLDGDLISSIIE